MRWRAVSVLFALVSAGNAAADMRVWLDAQVPQRLVDADIPAAAVAIVHGEATIVVGYGAADDALFRVGSVSKPVTASVVLALLAQNDADPRDDLAGMMADLPVDPPLQSPLTLHHLLTHTAGFNERLFGQHTLVPEALMPLDGYLRRHLPPRFIRPGQIIAYNDHHTALAGWVAEHYSGMDFDALARRLVFTPLGMADSTFAQVDLPGHLHARLVAARDGAEGHHYPRDFIHLTPAAGLYTTAPDMARYMQALLQQRLPGSGAQLAVQFRHHPQLPGRSYGFAESHHGSLQYFYKDGQASGFNARMLLVPELQLGIFSVHNRNIFGPLGRVEAAGRFHRTLAVDLLERFYPQSTAKAEVRADSLGEAATDAALEDYVGAYRTVVAARHTWERLASGFDEAVVRAGQSRLHLGSRRFTPLGEGLFVNALDADHYLAFRRSEAGVSHLFIGGGAYERVPWWTTQAALPWVVALPFLLLLFSAVRLLRIDGWSIVFAHGALLAFFVCFALFMWQVDTQRLFHGPPVLLLVLLLMPLVSAGGFALQLARVTRLRRLERLVGLSAAGVLFAWLSYWNLLGYHLG